MRSMEAAAHAHRPGARLPRVAITGCFAHAAAARRTDLIARALRHAGAETTVAPLEPPPCSTSADAAAPRRPSAIGERVLLRGLAARRGLVTLGREARGGVDAIVNYSESWTYSLPVWRLARRHRIRLIQDCVEWYEPLCFGGSRRHLLLLDHCRKRERVSARADGLTVITSRLAALYADRGATTFLLPPLCDIDEFDRVAPKPNPRSDRLLDIVVVASGKPADGDELIDPILQEAERRGVRFRVTVIGFGNPLERVGAIGAHTFERGAAVVRLQNLSRRDYVRALAAADVFLLPRKAGLSSEAAFPNRVPEFLAAGGVVVTSDVGDLSRYVDDRVSGIVCDAGDVSAFASALSWIAANPAEAVRIGQNGRRVAALRLDYRIHGTRLLDFVLGRSASAGEEAATMLPSDGWLSRGAGMVSGVR